MGKKDKQEEVVEISPKEKQELIDLTIELLTKGGVKMDIDKLIPYERNNKIHTDEQVDKIANSIAEFGFVQPLVVDGQNVLIIGHGRLEAAKKLGLKYVPVVVADYLSIDQVRKLRILDNKLNESERHLENLKMELDQIGELKLGGIKMIEMFPEFDIPKFNGEDYGDGDQSSGGGPAKQVAVIVYVKDQGEASLLVEDLDNNGRTHHKIL